MTFEVLLEMSAVEISFLAVPQRIGGAFYGIYRHLDYIRQLLDSFLNVDRNVAALRAKMLEHV